MVCSKGNLIRKGLSLRKSGNLPSFFSPFGKDPDNLISLKHVFADRRTDRQAYPAAVVRFQIHRCHCILSCDALSGSLRHLINSCRIIHIIYGTRFLRKLSGISSGVIIRRHAPSGEKLCQIALCRRTGKPHQILISASVQVQRHSARRRRRCRIARITVCSCKKQMLCHFLPGSISFIIIIPVIGKMKLPVHSQLCKYIVGIPCGIGRHLFKHFRILKTHGIVRIPCLRQYGIIIVGHLRMGVGGLIDLMADLVSDAPSKVSAALISAIRVSRYRSCTHQTGNRSPFNSYMVTGCIHKCAGKHLHVADIQIPVGKMMVFGGFIRCSVGKGTGQPFVLVKQTKHVVHCLCCTAQAGYASVSKPGHHLACRNGKHHIVCYNIRHIQNAGAFIIHRVCAYAAVFR